MTEQAGTGNERLISGRAVARSIETRAAAGASALQAAGVQPVLAVVFIGEHADAASYRRVIGQGAARTGVTVEAVYLQADTDAHALQATLERLNTDPTVHGVLVQTPLTAEQRQVVTYHLDSAKDVEGMTPARLGRLVLNDPDVLPCTAAAVTALIESRVPDLRGKRVVIVNRSPTIGRPLSQILLSRHATVTVCSSATRDLAAEMRRAEILVVAIGKARQIGPDHVGEGAIVIDVGINEDPAGSGICGDVDTAAVLDRVAAITPVPGGVGPVTTAIVLANTVDLARLYGSGGMGVV